MAEGKTRIATRHSPPATRHRLNVLVPKRGALIGLRDILWRELREGGMFHRYLEREKAGRTARARAVAKAFSGCRPNPKNDMPLSFAVPMRDAIRLLQMDPHFFDDDWNLRYLKRQEPDLPIFV